MNEKSFESKLARVNAPAPDPEARLRAKRAALEEFARVQAANQDADPVSESASKGLWDALRLFRVDSSHGRTSMNWFVSRNLFAGVAGACVLALGIAIVWPFFSKYGDSRLFDDLRPPASTEGLPAQESAPAPVPAPETEEPLAEPKLAKTAPPQSADAVQATREKFEAQAPPIEADIVEEPAAVAELQSLTGEPIPSEVASPEYLQRTAEQMQADAQARAVAQAQVQAETQRSARETESLESVVVTGPRRSAAAARAPHKGVAPPVANDASNSRMLIAPTSTAAMPSSRLDVRPGMPEEGRDKFQQFDVNPVKQVADEPVSTFSADVDTASYSFMRRQLSSGRLPQKDSVRVEEMINYFDYAWPAATSAKSPFRPTVVVSDSPWGKGRKLVHIGIKGYEVPRDNAPGANLVLLLDVSGSMDSPDKLPLAVQSMELLLSSLKPTDTVGIVVYAGEAGTVLEPTAVKDKQKIISALRDLRPGGSTAGAQGIERAYQLAEANFRKGGVNRILLATDGDFNVGIASTNELKGFVERKREKGIFLSVLGFGQGNYRDELAQALAQNGNGVAVYIDTLGEAQKVLVQEAGASLFTIARDVKLQVEFNPQTVAEYRLVGYETRALKREDFNNDAVDAGDVGSGHTVTAIYEITPVDSATRMVDKSRYAKEAQPPAAAGKASEYGFLKIRYKLPDSDTSDLIEQPILIAAGDVPRNIQRDVQFSTAVAGFGQLLRGGTFTGALKYDDVINQAQAAKGDDAFGYRTEFVQLVRKAKVAREM
ncbi:MAG TPA: von Willebrand factor type A domain-containing protein [Steroidobacteraceae bacterium]|nr:von Willebrand factor type A domain-containing protein [Steroidobacteraceae bacterium]